MLFVGAVKFFGRSE